MTDQIDALERLAQLRAQGALTEAEFQAEKKKLVNLAAPLSRSDNDGEDDAERALTTIGRWAWIIALAVTAGILMLAWDRFGFGGQGTLAGRRGLVDQAVGAEPQWTRQDETNPINDRRQISAFRREDADGFIIETTISCEPDKAATTYTFTSYAADGSTGAVFRDAGPGNFAEARADDKEPSFFWNMRPTYSNVLEVTVDPGSDFPLANRLLVKLHLAQGEPMITLDQTDPVLAGVLQPCAEKGRKAMADKAKQPRRWNTPAGLKSNGIPLTKIYQITDASLKEPDNNGKLGFSHFDNFCVGDTVTVQNVSSATVRPAFAPPGSDDLSDWGEVKPGSSRSLRLSDPGEFVIINQAQIGPAFHFDVAQCQ